MTHPKSERLVTHAFSFVLTTLRQVKTSQGAAAPYSRMWQARSFKTDERVLFSSSAKVSCVCVEALIKLLIVYRVAPERRGLAFQDVPPNPGRCASRLYLMLRLARCFRRGSMQVTLASFLPCVGTTGTVAPSPTYQLPYARASLTCTSNGVW